MSTTPEFELDLDLQLLPAWAQQPSTVNRYARFEGDTERDRPDRRGRGDRPPGPRRDRPPGPRGPGGDAGGGRPWHGPRGRDDRRPDGRRPEGRFGPREERPGEREPQVPLPEVECALLPEAGGVDSLTRQIKLTGRAYPLFDVAALILKKPDRYVVQFSAVKKPDGAVAQPLLACSLDESVWLDEAELVAHVLRHHFGTFYQTERVPTDPPKGTYTFVAQCGLSGQILGPPNFHDYQTKLRRLHAERYSRMPFEVYKARVRIVRDEAVVKQWIEEQSFKTEFVCLNVPETLKLPSRDEVEKHFRQVHLPNLVRTVETLTLPAAGKRPALAAGLQALQRRVVEEQRRFPIRLATVLSQQFASRGLQFFKVNRTVTHVCVARPHYLDLENTVVSDGVRRIVDFINAHPNTTRRKLLLTLAPTPAAPAVVPSAPPPPAAEPVAAPAPAMVAVQPDAGAAPGTETAPAAEAAAAPAPPSASAAAAPTAAPAPVVASPAQPEPTPEQTAIIADLHWLVHQGHVIEFGDGRMEMAKKPAPRPPRPAPKAAPAVAAAPAEAAPAEAAPEEVASSASPEASPTAAEAAESEAPAGPPVSREPVASSAEGFAADASSSTTADVAAETATPPTPAAGPV